MVYSHINCIFGTSAAVATAADKLIMRYSIQSTNDRRSYHSLSSALEFFFLLHLKCGAYLMSGGFCDNSIKYILIGLIMSVVN